MEILYSCDIVRRKLLSESASHSFLFSKHSSWSHAVGQVFQSLFPIPMKTTCSEWTSKVFAKIWKAFENLSDNGLRVVVSETHCYWVASGLEQGSGDGC